MKKTFISLILIISLALLSTTSLYEAKESTSLHETYSKKSAIQLKYDMQKLWLEHAWWTRSFIISNLANLDDQNDVLERLLQNQVDIGNIIKPYYGKEAGNELTELLKEHIVIAGQIVDAAKKGDQANVDKFNKKWYQNADDIVAFLTRANPNWSKEELTEMFYTHLEYTIDEVEYRLNKNWAADIKTADQNEAHLIHMGDMMTDGIVKQFPKKFKKHVNKSMK